MSKVELGEKQDLGSRGVEFGGCAIRHMHTVMRLLLSLSHGMGRVTRWGLFLRRGARVLFEFVA